MLIWKVLLLSVACYFKTCYAIDCYSCVTQQAGQICETDPANDPHGRNITCNEPNDECVVWTSIFTNGGAIRTVARNCKSQIGTPTIDQYRNKCSENSQFRECYNVCNTNACNKFAALVPEGWNADGTKKSSGGGGGVGTGSGIILAPSQAFFGFSMILALYTVFGI